MNESLRQKLFHYMMNDSIPADIAKAAWSGMKLPGDVYSGRAAPNDAGRVMDLAGMVVGSAFPASKLAKGAENIASRSPRMYDPPVKTPRPIEADYPAGATADETGRIRFDIEGRPLGARHVVGRNMVGQGEKALSPAELDAIAEATTGSLPATVAPGILRGDAGRTRFDSRTGEPLGIALSKDLSAPQADRVLGHEVGHVIDQLAGEIPVKGLKSELRTVYNDLNNSQTHGKPFGPKDNGYAGDHIDRELMTEAVRAYMADPNYIKSVAPETAARIRKFVNANPKLKDTIQFNSIGGAAAMLGGGGLAGLKPAAAEERFGELYRAGMAL